MNKSIRNGVVQRLMGLVAPRAPAMPQVRAVRLVGNAIHKLEAAAQRVHVLHGVAYISVDGQDFIVQRNQHLQLPRSRHPALISSAGAGELVLEIKQ